MPLPKLRNVPLTTRWPLVALALSLTACAAPSPTPPVAPTLPAKPLLTEPLPSVTYSESARVSLQRWREKLTPTHPTSEPSKSPGPNSAPSKTD